MKNMTWRTSFGAALLVAAFLGCASEARLQQQMADRGDCCAKMQAAGQSCHEPCGAQMAASAAKECCQKAQAGGAPKDCCKSKAMTAGGTAQCPAMGAGQAQCSSTDAAGSCAKPQCCKDAATVGVACPHHERQQ